MERPLISIAIPILNEAEILEKNLRRLVACLATIYEPVEVFLCDSGSTDDSLSIATRVIETMKASHHRWSLLTSPKPLSPGQSCGRIGTEFKGDWLFVLPLDCLIQAKHIESILRLQPTNLWGGFRKAYHPSSTGLKLISWWLNEFRSKRFHHLVWTNGIFISRDLYLKYPLPMFGFMEDVVWSDALRQSKAKFCFFDMQIQISDRHFKRMGFMRATLLNSLILILFRLKLAKPRALQSLSASLSPKPMPVEHQPQDLFQTDHPVDKPAAPRQREGPQTVNVNKETEAQDRHPSR